MTTLHSTSPSDTAQRQRAAQRPDEWLKTPYRTALIPERERSNGPVTTARLRRAGVVYLTLAAVGLGLAWLAESPRAQAFGLGLVFPGGGFLLHAAGGVWSAVAHVAFTLVTLLAFALALFAWFGSGNILAPIGVWLGAALAAAAMSNHMNWPVAHAAVPGLVAAFVAAVGLQQRRSATAARARRGRRNAYLADSRAFPSPRDPATGMPRVEELSSEDVAAMRFLLDRALQPRDRFEGFDWIEQFQTSSVRYQVMGISYALSVAQASRLPALRGYLLEAQRNLIDKMMDHRLWSYWALENAWGNLRLDPDPMAPATHDNVMYSGWYAAMIGMHASNTGDDRYERPGSIVFRHPRGREFVYDWPGIVGILADNFTRCAFTLFPCEPNWIYVMCNNFAGIALRIHDRLHGTQHWPALEPEYRQSLEHEFMTLDGRLVAIRSARTGLTIPSLTSTMADAVAALYMHPLLPDIARRSWEIVRRDLVHIGTNGARVDLRGWDRIDTGNYRRSTATTLAAVMAAATEMGDPEARDALRAALEAEHPPVLDAGVLHYPAVSVTGHVAAFCSRAGRTNAMLDLVAHGLPGAWRNGPLLETVTYPEVLVAKAVSDGAALDAIVTPGARPGRYAFGLAQLQPGQRYRCRGTVEDTIAADADGRRKLTVDLDGRREISVRPEG
jgi:hypothetical protein